MDLHQQFVHFHNGSILIGTGCFLIRKSPQGDEECAGYGFAFPSRKDIATKARGRAIAAGRAKKVSQEIDGPFALSRIVDWLKDEVIENSRRGINQEQLNQKVENVRRWFFPPQP